MNVKKSASARPKDLASDIIDGTADATGMATLIDNETGRRNVFSALSGKIEEALRRAESRGVLSLPETCFPIRDILPGVLTLQLAAGAAWPQEQWGRDRMTAAAEAWSERLRRLIWSGTVNYSWGHEGVFRDGHNWGLESEGWAFRLMRQDPALRRIVAWQPSALVLPVEKGRS